MTDLRVLAIGHQKIGTDLSLLDGGEFTVPVQDGRWVGVCTAIVQDR
jgi:hypothetical protein